MCEVVLTLSPLIHATYPPKGLTNQTTSHDISKWNSNVCTSTHIRVCDSSSCCDVEVTCAQQLLSNEDVLSPTLIQEVAQSVCQEPCASLTPITWTASYRGQGQGEELHFDHKQGAFRWSPSFTRYAGVSPEHNRCVFPCGGFHASLLLVGGGSHEYDAL